MSTLEPDSKRVDAPSLIDPGDKEKNLTDRIEELWTRGSLSGVEEDEFLEAFNKLNTIAGENGSDNADDATGAGAPENAEESALKYDVGILGCDFFRLPHKVSEEGVHSFVTFFIKEVQFLTLRVNRGTFSVTHVLVLNNSRS